MNNVYTYSPLDRVIWDTPSLEAIESEIERLNAKKVFIVSSSTLSKKTDEIQGVQHARSGGCSKSNNV